MKKVLTAAVATAGLTTAMAAVAMPAHASTSQCQQGDRLCLWDDDGFDDTFGAWNQSRGDLGAFNNKASSVWNRSPVAWTLNDGTGGASRTICVKSGAFESNLRNFGFTDKTSSMTRLPNNNCPAGLRVIS